MHELLKLFMNSLLIRRIEEEISRRYPEQEMRCPVHLSLGQEVNAAAIAGLLTPEDYMVSTHRSHAHYLAKGGNLNAMICELYGKSDGCSKGHGGSMHLVDRSVGFMGSTSIVGGTIPIGVGLAFAAKIKGEKRLSTVCLGDGALEEGVFHESCNFAALHQLPVIFYVENNMYSCYTHINDRQHALNLPALATYYGMDYFELNYETFFDDYLNLLKLKIKKPIIIESEAWRFIEHCGPNNDDHLNYRSESEIEYHEKNDLLLGLESLLIKNKIITEDRIQRSEKMFQIIIESAFNYAKNSPYPDEKDLGKYLYV